MSPYTLQEIVTRNFMINDKPDAIVNIVDVSNIERNLYLTTQILELGIPTVVALNITDIVKKNGDKIDVDKLSKLLCCPVVKISAIKTTVLVAKKNVVATFGILFGIVDVTEQDPALIQNGAGMFIQLVHSHS